MTNFNPDDELAILRDVAPVHVGFIETLEQLHVSEDSVLRQKDADAAREARRAREDYEKWVDSLTDGQQNVTRLAGAFDHLLNCVGIQGLILAELKQMLPRQGGGTPGSGP